LCGGGKLGENCKEYWREYEGIEEKKRKGGNGKMNGKVEGMEEEEEEVQLVGGRMRNTAARMPDGHGQHRQPKIQRGRLLLPKAQNNCAAHNFAIILKVPGKTVIIICWEKEGKELVGKMNQFLATYSGRNVIFSGEKKSSK
jgi:hypothetical protein